MKKTAAILLAIILCIAAAVPSFAEEGFVDKYYRASDYLDGMTYDEWENLCSFLDEIANRQRFDVTCALESGIGNETIDRYAADMYSEYQYGYGDDKDGIFLFVNGESGEWYIYTCGKGTRLFNADRINNIGEQVKDDIAAGRYYYAFMNFAELCDGYITEGYPTLSVEAQQPITNEQAEAKTAKPGEVSAEQENSGKKKPLSIMWLPISFGVGILVAFIVVGSMKASMKTVHMQAAASDYTKSGSFSVTESRDVFLYRDVERTERPKNNTEEK